MAKGRLLDKSHPGQRKRSARKRILQRQKRLQEARRRLTSENRAQRAQDKVRCFIIVNGMTDWTEAFANETARMRGTLGPKYFGAEDVPLLDVIRLGADLNQVSYEREVLGEFLSRGYTLESLEVEFDDGDRRAWGRCTWQKDHPSYHAQESDEDKRLSPWAKSLLRPYFSTSRAGEQRFTLLSTQMVAMALLKQDPRILLHKSLIFRKAILSPPKPAQDSVPLKKAA